MPTPTELLDRLLPLLQPRGNELHEHATVLEVGESAQLIELASQSKIRRFLLARLSDTVALVDPGQTDALAKVLLTQGQTPKVAKGVVS